MPALYCTNALQTLKAGMKQVLVLMLIFQLGVGIPLIGFAQETPDPIEESNGTTPEPDNASAPQTHTFSQRELDQILAPIALYPDALLSQIMMAATYPLEVVEAARWSKANPTLKGDQAVQAVQGMNWDPSVKSMVAFPDILKMMDEKLTWMAQLGDAFLSQQAAVMDTIQNLRHRADAAGNLTSNDKIKVNHLDNTIVVEPVNPQVVYVPYYDPLTIYGPWWWPGYPPYYWPPWPGYFFGPGLGLYWGLGIGIGAGFFYGAFNFPRHQVIINRTFIGRNGITRRISQNWQHSPGHRMGVPYRDEGTRQRFGGFSRTMPAGRGDFRGHAASSIGEGRVGRNRAGETRMSGGRSAEFSRSFSQSSGTSHAFEGVGHGADVQRNEARGTESFRGFSSRHSGGSRGGGGYGRSFGGGGHHGGRR